MAPHHQTFGSMALTFPTPGFKFYSGRFKFKVRGGRLDLLYDVRLEAGHGLTMTFEFVNDLYVSPKVLTTLQQGWLTVKDGRTRTQVLVYCVPTIEVECIFRSTPRRRGLRIPIATVSADSLIYEACLCFCGGSLTFPSVFRNVPVPEHFFIGCLQFMMFCW